MKGYLIKTTYTEGTHAGKSHLLGKGTRVMDGHICWSEYCYKTLGAAKRICKLWYEDNELSKKCERVDEACRIARGGKPKNWYIYESKTYEPYEVEMVEL